MVSIIALNFVPFFCFLLYFELTLVCCKSHFGTFISINETINPLSLISTILSNFDGNLRRKKSRSLFYRLT